MADAQHGDLKQQMDSLREDLNQLRGDMKEMLQSLVETGKSEASEMKQRVQGRVREKSDMACEKGREFAERVETTIEENPMSAVLAALGVGFLLGFITSHK